MRICSAVLESLHADGLIDVVKPVGTLMQIFSMNGQKMDLKFKCNGVNWI
jgi:hypothetical protein